MIANKPNWEAWRAIRHNGILKTEILSTEILNTQILWFPTDIDHPGAHVLSAEEQARAARFYFEGDRRRHTTCRATLRQVLAERLDLLPEDIQFEFNEYGKPRLANASTQQLDFNLSHSGKLAVLALSSGTPIGVDVEEIRPLLDWEEIAKRFYSRREGEWLHSIPPEQRTRGFFRLWTLKEAVLKADGRGLSFPLDKIEIDLSGAVPVLTGGDWRLAELELEPGYVAALAVR